MDDVHSVAARAVVGVERHGRGQREAVVGALEVNLHYFYSHLPGGSVQHLPAGGREADGVAAVVEDLFEVADYLAVAHGDRS